MKNVKEVKINIKGKEWEDILDKAFNKKKKDIKVDGFRKGAVPKDIYLKKVGIENLFMDAADIAINDNYRKVIEDSKVDVVCEPSVAIEKIDKDGIEIKFTLIGRPEVKIGAYKNLGVKKDKVEVKKDEVEHEIHHIIEHMAEVVIKENGEVLKDNTAVIDFDGVVDGKPLDGGSGKDYALEIGSNSFIPGFEEGLIGMKKGETKELKLKFPEDYVENLKGKEVTFTVTVKEIKERIEPKMDKDFFEDLGIEGVDSKEKLEEHIKKELLHEKEHQADDKYVDELLRKATDNMKVEINDEIIDNEVERMINQYNQEMQMQGATLEQYLQMMGQTIDELKVRIRPQAIARVKVRYLLEEVVKAEKIEVSKKEIDEKVKSEAEIYGMKEDEFVTAIGGTDAIKYEIEMNKAIDLIKES